MRVVVDNTFASPYVQRPLTLGADLVLHSTTKFLNGHSDSVGGVVIVAHQDDEEWLRFVQNAAGAILGPMDAWLVLRGTKTLPIRMERTNANTMRIAEFLAGAPAGDPDHLSRAWPAIRTTPWRRGRCRASAGSSPSTSARSTAPARCWAACRLMALAESLGGVETLISHPAIMTHASVPAERRAALGITDGLIRISVGIEDIDDLLEDLGQALGSGTGGWGWG